MFAKDPAPSEQLETRTRGEWEIRGEEIMRERQTDPGTVERLNYNHTIERATTTTGVPTIIFLR